MKKRYHEHFSTSEKYKIQRIRTVWTMMKYRCSNPAHVSYINYGARGISVCSEWLNFNIFLQWILSKNYEPGIGLQIDRINNNGNYEPSNCHFVTTRVNNSIGKKRLYRNNKSGYAGVRKTRSKSKPWAAYINYYKVKNEVLLGRFETKEDAILARIKAERELIKNRKREKIRVNPLVKPLKEDGLFCIVYPIE